MEDHRREVAVYDLGTTSYEEVHRLQQRLQTQRREGSGQDTLLLTEHRPVFTLGRSHPEPDLRVAADTVHQYGIEIVQTERGGDITYHGPGQLVAYLLLDLKRRKLGVKALVQRIEAALIALLGEYGIAAERRAGAPGVYVDGAKIAALGLKIKNGCSYHGLSLNVAMDLAPFSAINPCGYEGLAVTQLSELCGPISVGDIDRVGDRLVAQLERTL